MSRKADLIFCKVAITAGMVSPQQAQKALAFVDKREQETGRRPLLGAVFTKYQLLTQEQVQRVNEAVAKRTGGAHPAHVPRGGGKGGKARRKKKKPTRRIDPKLLKQGIAFGIVFLGVVIAIAVLYLNKPGDEGGSSAGANVASGADVGSSGGASAAGAVAAPPQQELPREYAGRFYLTFGDIRHNVTENPALARDGLAKALAELKKLEKNYILPANLTDLRDQVKSAVAGAEEIVDPRGTEADSASTSATTSDSTPVAEEKASSAAADEGGDDDLGSLDDLDELDDF